LAGKYWTFFNVGEPQRAVRINLKNNYNIREN